MFFYFSVWNIYIKECSLRFPGFFLHIKCLPPQEVLASNNRKVDWLVLDKVTWSVYIVALTICEPVMFLHMYSLQKLDILSS